MSFFKFSFGGVDQFWVGLGFFIENGSSFLTGKGLTPTFSKMHIHQIIGTSHSFSKMDTMHQTHHPWGHATF